jgi:hypothetical protein
MDTRAQIAADAIGSVRAEGLEPGRTVVQVLDRWIDGAYDLAHLQEFHPFREGNGRAQRALLRQLALDADHTLTWEHLDSEILIHASQRSFQGDNRPMRALIEEVLDLPHS